MALYFLFIRFLSAPLGNLQAFLNVTATQVHNSHRKLIDPQISHPVAVCVPVPLLPGMPPPPSLIKNPTCLSQPDCFLVFRNSYKA